MTFPPVFPQPAPASYGRNRLYKTATAQTDANGNATLAFAMVPTGYVWSGSVYCIKPQVNIGAFLAFRGNQYMGGWSSTGALHGVQAADGAVVTVQASNLPAATLVQMAWQGRVDPIGEAPLMEPSVTGPSGAQLVATSPLFPVDIVQTPDPAKVLSAEVDSDQGTGLNVLVAGIGGSRLRLWSATLSMAMAELAATAGVKAWACDIEVHGGAPIVLKMPLRTVPAAAVSGSVSQNCYGLIVASGLGLDLNSPANTADGSRVVGTVLYDVLTP